MSSTNIVISEAAWWIRSAVALVGLTLNIISLKQVISCFDLRRPVLWLIFVDIIISCIGLLMSLILGVWARGNYWGCAGFFLALFIPGLLGVWIMAAVAIIRYIALKRALEGIPEPVMNPKTTKCWALFSILFWISYSCGYIFLCWTMSWSPAHLFMACMGEYDANSDHSNIHLLFVAVVLGCTVSAVFDMLITLELKQFWSSESRLDPRALVEVPVRATIWSSVLLITACVVCITVRLVLKDSDSAAFSFALIAFSTVISLQCPLTCYFTYTNKIQNEALWDQRAQTEARRQKVIQSALEEKQKRIQLKLEREKRETVA